MIKLRHIYLSIGIHTSPPGTLFYHLNQTICNFGRALTRKPTPLPIKTKLKKGPYALAFWISGGIGDYLIAARYIRDLFAETGDVPFDVYASNLTVAKWIFSLFPSYRDSYTENCLTHSVLALYPFAIRLTSYIEIYPSKLGHKDNSPVSKRLRQACLCAQKYNDKIPYLIKFHPHLDGYLGEFATRHDFTRMTIQQGASGIAYGGDILPLSTDQSALAKFGIAAARYVTIHNGHDTEFRIKDKTLDTASTKTYPHFAELITLLRQRMPGLKIIQIGARTSAPIEGCDINLIDQTTLPECAEILRHSMLHIDGESGLVHMAACLGVRSCVVFGPTSVDFFGYAQNINIRPTFCGNCWWMTEDWLEKCPRGFEQPRCLSEQKPEIIATEIMKALQDQAAA